MSKGTGSAIIGAIIGGSQAGGSGNGSGSGITQTDLSAAINNHDSNLGAHVELLARKANIAQVTTLEARVDQKADISHGHPIDDVTDLAARLNSLEARLAALEEK